MLDAESDQSNPRSGHDRPGQGLRSPWLAAAALLLLLAVITCVHGFRPGRVLVPVDLVYRDVPWSDPRHGVRPANPLLYDQAVQFVPWMSYTVERLRAGQVPLWNPYSQLGVPFVGNGQSAVFYPTTLLHLLLPDTWSWTLGAVLRLWIAGLGALALAAYLGISSRGRLLAGVAFMLCGFNVVWLNHPHTNVSPWLPWAVLTLLRLVDRPSVLRVGTAALVVTVQLLGGHPSCSAHLTATCALLLAGTVLVRGWRQVLRALPAVVVAMALGFLGAGVQCLPLLAYVRDSGAALARGSMAARSWEPGYLLGIVFPYANGYPTDEVPPDPAMMSYATGLPNTNELAPGHVGVVALALGLLAVAVRRETQVRLWGGLAVLVAAVAIRLPMVRDVVAVVPVLNLSWNSRWMVSFALGAALLAGFGLDALSAPIPARALRRLRLGLGLAAGACALGAVTGVLGLLLLKGPIVDRGLARARQLYAEAHTGSRGPVRPLAYYERSVGEIHTELVLTAARLLIPATALGIVALSFRRRPDRTWEAPRRPGLWIAVSAAELLLFAVPYNPGARRQSYLPRAPALEYLQARAREGGAPFRVAGTFGSFRPEYCTAYRLADVRGYDCLTPRPNFEWLHEVQGLPRWQPDVATTLRAPDSPALRLLNLRYLVTAPEEAPPGGRWRRVYPLAREDSNAVVYEDPEALPRAWIAAEAVVVPSRAALLGSLARPDFDPLRAVLLEAPAAGGEAPSTAAAQPVYRVVSPEHVRVRLDASPGGWLVVADTCADGWTATLTNGRTGEARPARITPAYGILRAVALPPDWRGDPVEVAFDYAPRSWRVGLAATAAGLSLSLALVLFGAVTSSRSRPRAGRRGPPT